MSCRRMHNQRSFKIPQDPTSRAPAERALAVCILIIQASSAQRDKRVSAVGAPQYEGLH